MHAPFVVKAASGPGIQNNWTASLAGQPDLTLSIPPQFAGPGTGWSPEDLYAQALLNCFIATFKVFAEKSQFSFSSVECEASLEVGKNEKGLLVMKHITIKARLLGCQDHDKGKALLEKASAGCMIMNSVNTEKTLELEIRS